MASLEEKLEFPDELLPLFGPEAKLLQHEVGTDEDWDDWFNANPQALQANYSDLTAEQQGELES